MSKEAPIVRIRERIIQRVCELPYNMPDEFDAETMVGCTDAELGIIVEDEIRESSLLAVPGEWTCDKCGFGLSTRTLHVLDGSISARSVMETPTCPNDGTPLRSMTWRELAESQREGVTDLSQRLSAAMDALQSLIRPDNGYCNQCHGHWSYRRDGSWVYSDGQHHLHCVGRAALGGEGQ